MKFETFNNLRNESHELNSRIKEVYSKNINLLQSMKNIDLIAAKRELYYHDGILDDESMGALKLETSSGLKLVFSCDGDAESLHVNNGDFGDNSKLQLEMPEFKWKIIDFINFDKCKELKNISDIQIQYLACNGYAKQSGCIIHFENGEFLYIWTSDSDGIYYGLNSMPNYGNKNVELLTQYI